MKKLVAILVAAFMTAGMVGCSGGAAKTDNGGATPAKTEGSESAKPEEGNKEKVKAALLISGNLGDMSFNDSAHAGMQKAIEELGIESTTIECNSDASKYEPTLLEAAEAGNNLVIASSNFKDYMEAYADDYPETTFILFDEEVDWTKGDLKNVYCILYKNNEGSFLGGYLAGELTKSGLEGYNDKKIIGFLGGMDQPVINDFLVGYIEGAQYADPDIKVATVYANSFSDSAKGKELSISLINQGADISFNVAGGTGIGLIEAAVESGTKVLGVDSDQAMVFKDTKPDYSKAIPTSVLKNVGFTLYRAVEKYVDGSLKVGETETLGIAEGAVGLADNEFYQAQVPAEIITKLKDLEEKVKSGEIEIGTAYGRPTDEIVAIRNAVKP